MKSHIPHPTRSTFNNLTGMKFGRLTVESYAGSRLGHSLWNVVCDCGTRKIQPSNAMKSGMVVSCGCYHREVVSRSSHKHGMHKSGEYLSYHNMIQRCTNPKALHYDQYGGRGISVHHSWVDSFESFYAHVGPRTTPKHTIDRIDVNSNYEPGNVRWATRKEQADNRRTTLRKTIDGVTMTVKDWSVKTGVPHRTLTRRYHQGLSDSDFLSTTRLSRKAK